MGLGAGEAAMKYSRAKRAVDELLVSRPFPRSRAFLAPLSEIRGTRNLRVSPPLLRLGVPAEGGCLCRGPKGFDVEPSARHLVLRLIAVVLSAGSNLRAQAPQILRKEGDREDDASPKGSDHRLELVLRALGRHLGLGNRLLPFLTCLLVCFRRDLLDRFCMSSQGKGGSGSANAQHSCPTADAGLSLARRSRRAQRWRAVMERNVEPNQRDRGDEEREHEGDRRG